MGAESSCDVVVAFGLLIACSVGSQGRFSVLGSMSRRQVARAIIRERSDAIIISDKENRFCLDGRCGRSSSLNSDVTSESIYPGLGG